MALFDMDGALIAALRADATLITLAPGGTHQDLAPAGTSGVFVTVSLMSGRDELELNGATAYWEREYVIAAWVSGLAPAGAEAAAERVDAVMLARPTLSGYAVMDVTRVDVINRKVIDEAGIWQQRGCRYRVQATPNG